MTIRIIKKKIIPILKNDGVIKAAIFGSYATGEQKKNSDIDIVIKYKKNNKSLFDLIQLQHDLEKKLGKKVDLLTYGGIHPLLKDIILKEQKIIYEERP